jgi:hypothetical protein
MPTNNTRRSFEVHYSELKLQMQSYSPCMVLAVRYSVLISDDGKAVRAIDRKQDLIVQNYTYGHTGYHYGVQLVTQI